VDRCEDDRSGDREDAQADQKFNDGESMAAHGAYLSLFVREMVTSPLPRSLCDW
jgi:hypothetical protein